MLATGTDGRSFFIDDSDSGQGLNDAFIGSLIYEPAVASGDMVVKVKHFKMLYAPPFLFFTTDSVLMQMFQQQYTTSGQVNQNFTVDFTVGRDMAIRVDYQLQTQILSLVVVSPTGVLYQNPVFDNTVKSAFIRIPNAEVL